MSIYIYYGCHTTEFQSQATISLSHIYTVLLQTARAQVTSLNHNISGELRLLFDSGGQLNHITPATRSYLQLKSLPYIK